MQWRNSPRQNLEAYDPVLSELIGRVFDTHHIPMDIYHGKRIRPVTCPAAAGPDRSVQVP